MFRLSGRIGVLALAALPACEAATSRAVGTIEGRVTLGPIMPVCREGIPCDGAYAGAKIVVRDKDDAQVARTTADGTGAFRVDVAAGAYAVGVSVDGPMPTCEQVEVTVTAQQSARADIDCDSGIR